MNETDAMTQLANANPIQVEDLNPLDAPDRLARHVPGRRLILAFAVLVVAAAAVTAAYAFDGSNGGQGDRAHLGEGLLHPGVGDGDYPSGPTGSGGPGRPQDPTTAFYTDGPTGANGPTRTNAASGTAGPASLADAREALGAPLVLPDVPPVDPSNIGKVVKDCGESPRSTACDVGLGFLAQRVWIYYQPAAQWNKSSDPLAAYKNSVKYDPRARIVYLSGTPALVSPGGGPNGGNVEFVLGGVRVRVWVVDPVPPGGPSLQAIAQSIVDRSK